MSDIKVGKSLGHVVLEGHQNKRVVKSLGHVVLEHPEETRVVKSLGHVVLRAPIQATTRQPSNVSETQASLRGYFDGGIIATANAHFEYKKVGDVSWSTTATEEVPTEEVFSADIVTEANESYEFRAVVDTGADLYYGEIVTFNAVWVREGSQEDFERGILDGVEVIDDKLQLVADGELGTRQKPYHIPEAKQGEISWEATTPTDTTLTIEAQVQGTTAITDEVVGTGDGIETVFYLDHWPADTPTIKVDGVAETGFTLGNDRRTITFDTAPADTETITASYTAVDDPQEDDPEIQTLDLDSPAGGTFKLGDGTTWTSDIAHDASVATIETALEGLYGAGKVEVEGLLTEELSIWLDADHSSTITLDVSDNVEQWDDKSGNDRHVSQATEAERPGYNAVSKAVTNTGANKFLSNAGAFSNIDDGTVNEYTLFAVCKPNKTSSGSRTQSASGTDFWSADSYNNILVRVSGNTGTTSGPVAPLFSFTTNYLALTETRNSLAPYIISRAHTVGANFALIMFERKTNRTTRSGINGVYAAGATGTVTNLSWDDIATPGFYTADSRWNGEISEILLFHNGSLNTATIEAIEGYLAHKWGIEADLPAAHPYKVTPPPPLKITFAHSVGNSGLVADFTGLT